MAAKNNAKAITSEPEFTDHEKKLIVIPNMKEVINYLHHHPKSPKTCFYKEDRKNDKINSTLATRLETLATARMVYKEKEEKNPSVKGGRPRNLYSLTNMGEELWKKLFPEEANNMTIAEVKPEVQISQPKAEPLPEIHTKKKPVPEAKPETKPAQEAKPEPAKQTAVECSFESIAKLYEELKNLEKMMDLNTFLTDWKITHATLSSELSALKHLGDEMGIRNLDKMCTAIDESSSLILNELCKLDRLAKDLKKLKVALVGNVTIKMTE